MLNGSHFIIIFSFILRHHFRQFRFLCAGVLDALVLLLRCVVAWYLFQVQRCNFGSCIAIFAGAGVSVCARCEGMRSCGEGVSAQRLSVMGMNNFMCAMCIYFCILFVFFLFGRLRRCKGIPNTDATKNERNARVNA